MPNRRRRFRGARSLGHRAVRISKHAAARTGSKYKLALRSAKDAVSRPPITYYFHILHSNLPTATRSENAPRHAHSRSCFHRCRSERRPAPRERPWIRAPPCRRPRDRCRCRCRCDTRPGRSRSHHSIRRRRGRRRAAEPAALAGLCGCATHDRRAGLEEARVCVISRYSRRGVRAHCGQPSNYPTGGHTRSLFRHLFLH
ncbi:hypothetical protein B0H10DRAFT_539308 [Mycena sp. CBHHK59/15]|nr:hypothetical protein B0H10DRAFT_539308 [Mycena sp. CBHHK59/15]